MKKAALVALSVTAIFSHSPAQAKELIWNAGLATKKLPVLKIFLAQDVSEKIHERCLAAADYAGCIRSNSVNQPSLGNSSSGEQCFANGFCVASSGIDQLGLPKKVGWYYKYYPENNFVRYNKPDFRRIPHKGQPSRYIAEDIIEHYYQQPTAAQPGYYKQTSPSTTNCTPNYSGGGKWVNGVFQRNYAGQTCTTSPARQSWVPGIPGTPGGPRSSSYRLVHDCKELTYGTYWSGKLKGKWKKGIGARNSFIRNVCTSSDQLQVLNMKL